MVFFWHQFSAMFLYNVVITRTLFYEAIFEQNFCPHIEDLIDYFINFWLIDSLNYKLNRETSCMKMFMETKAVIMRENIWLSTPKLVM